MFVGGVLLATMRGPRREAEKHEKRGISEDLEVGATYSWFGMYHVKMVALK